MFLSLPVLLLPLPFLVVIEAEISGQARCIKEGPARDRHTIARYFAQLTL
jgi:hypothetical protein